MEMRFISPDSTYTDVANLLRRGAVVFDYDQSGFGDRIGEFRYVPSCQRYVYVDYGECYTHSESDGCTTWFRAPQCHTFLTLGAMAVWHDFIGKEFELGSDTNSGHGCCDTDTDNTGR